jgi:hypothetical protein
MGRSITEPAVQQVYRDYVKGLSQRIQPAYLGVAAAMNLIRGSAGWESGRMSDPFPRRRAPAAVAGANSSSLSERQLLFNHQETAP